ncbi:MAG TPA: Wzz/FepE/Etk N-terminal domain-containing protein [Bryobacteraceae bacterium]|jgi:polysaccharide chain length determinant protein (PEP-CTERM system associated)|nr:Wzz/FepE/Etk N-terminal domain-containing protein [Bryobacteraceae bacterium]
MQPQDNLAATRRPLDVEDYIDILRRHKAWILGPVFAALVVSVVAAFLWPDTYVSTAVIRVVPPQVPANLVAMNTSGDVQGRINSLAQLILSRATLLNIINTQGLYKKELSRKPSDDVIEDMRAHDIKVVPVAQSLQQTDRGPQYPTFEIQFSYNNRFTAQKVVQDLVARFLEENVRQVSQETVSTTQFLRDQWDLARKKLDAVEQQLSVFRSKNLGHLPDEQQSNYQQLNAIQAQMLNLNTAMNRVNQEKLLFENQLRIYREQLSTLKDPVVQEQVLQQKDDKLAEKDREITQLENTLVAERQRYKDTHPDVQRLVALIASAKKQRETMAKEEETKKPETTAAAPARPMNPQFVREQRGLQEQIERSQAMIQAKDLEMEDYKKQAKDAEVAIRAYQSRIEGIPVGIKEYDELIRERDLAKHEYEDLDRRLSTSSMSTALVNHQQGERLEQLDPPSLPQTPSEPKRPLIIAVGTGIGFILGLCLAGAREAKDGALKNLKDVRAYTQLPVLGSIPLLENDLVVRRRRRLAWLAWSTACLVGVVIMSSSVVYYYATKL